MSAAAPAVVEAWKAHVLECGLCKNAKVPADLCPVGQNFWQQAPAPQPAPQQAPQQALAIDSHMAAQIAHHVASRVVARASSGGAIAVPMEKTSKAVTIATAPNVTLQMPERDIEVYAEMQGLIRELARVAQLVTNAITSEEETKRFVRQTPSLAHASDSEVALVVQHTRAQFGVGSDDQLQYEFATLAAKVLRMGDRLGNFMRVDDETRRISRAARELAIEMQEVLERSSVYALKLDERTRAVVRPMRRFAIDLQGEIERRVGTP